MLDYEFESGLIASSHSQASSNNHQCIEPILDSVDASQPPPSPLIGRMLASPCGAREIEAEIRYDDRVLRLRIRDDGKGIDRRVLEEGGRAGHWGLLGIRERTKRIGARLDIWSEAGAGTEIELTVPASIAYGTSRNGPAFRLFRKKVAKS